MALHQTYCIEALWDRDERVLRSQGHSPPKLKVTVNKVCWKQYFEDGGITQRLISSSEFLVMIKCLC